MRFDHLVNDPHYSSVSAAHDGKAFILFDFRVLLKAFESVFSICSHVVNKYIATVGGLRFIVGCEDKLNSFDLTTRRLTSCRSSRKP